MRISIDNLDGRGAVDYTGVVVADAPLAIQRRLNATSTCAGGLAPEAAGLPVPVRRGRVVVTSENGTTLFTGYVATDPLRVYAGQGTTGAVYTVHLSCVSDEWLLDRLGPAGDGEDATLDAGQLLEGLTARTPGGQGLLGVESAGSLRTTGVVTANETADWSARAQRAAGAGYAGYRVLGGQVSVQPAGTRVHALSDGDGTLDPAALVLASGRELANDVTLSGDEEPGAFITELFEGDGTTTQFVLSDPAFRGRRQRLLWDAFEESVLNAARWKVNDTGGYLGVGGGGLALTGGSGADGGTTLVAADAVEMGGTLVVEMRGVLLGSGSDGLLGGFYEGTLLVANCLVGFRVRQSSSGADSETLLVPVVNGAEAGTVFTLVEGHAYTLRLRLHGAEMYRVSQQYYCMADDVVQGFGGAPSARAPLDAVLEVVEEGAGSNLAATVLFDSAATGVKVTGSPSLGSFVLVNAKQMFGSMRSVRIERPGSLWVMSTAPGGGPVTRLTGVAGEGVDCEVRYGNAAGTPGSLLFFAERVPARGERIAVFYRGVRRAMARLADAASLAREANGGAAGVGVSRWLGKVLEPAARTSADCESAAQAVLRIATSRTAALAGRYEMTNPVADVWPGDVLDVSSEGVTSALLVRSVGVTDEHAAPELLRYDIRFANDWATEWADGLGLRLSDRIAEDAELPTIATLGPAEVLENLPALSVVSLSGTTLQVDAGRDAPGGGGFEVRRRDSVFGAGSVRADLVLRSSARVFEIPRAAQSERFYVRMFDGSSPPLYSRWSSAVFVQASVS